MAKIPIFVLSLGMLLLSLSGVNGEELPSSLACRSNAKASRDYAFAEKRWQGPISQGTIGSSYLFNIETRDSKVGDIFYSLRDKIFSGLNTSTPVVRSITRLPGGKDEGVEFTSKVMNRTGNAVLLLWTNDINKTWVAVVDLAQRKATVAQVFQGVTSVGGELETLDCQ